MAGTGPPAARVAEGHAVHGMAARVARLIGQPQRSSGPGSPDLPVELVDGRPVAATEAHGKHLLIHLSGDLSVHLHLGMHGAVSVRRHSRALAADGLPRTTPPDRPGLVWRALTPTHSLEITRPTVSEVLDNEGLARLHARLGPDPLRDDADPDLAVARLGRSRRPIGQLLLDQSVVSGIGNVYRAELLWRAAVGPHTPGRDLDEAALHALWADAADLMNVGLGAGWIVTDDEQVATARDLLVRGEVVPRWPKRYAVYGRRDLPCPRCGAPVAAERMGLQTVFWCPSCQR